jgi:hypothetical protein
MFGVRSKEEHLRLSSVWMHSLSSVTANVKVFASHQNEDAVLECWQTGCGVLEPSRPNAIKWRLVGSGTLPVIGAGREVEEGFADELTDELTTGPLSRIELFDPLVTAPGSSYAIILQSDQPFLCRSGGAVCEDERLLQLWGWICSSGALSSGEDIRVSNLQYCFCGAIQYEALQVPSVCPISASSAVVMWEPLFHNGVVEMRLHVSPEPPAGQPAAFTPACEVVAGGLLPETEYRFKLQIRMVNGGHFVDASSYSAAVLPEGAVL